MSRIRLYHWNAKEARPLVKQLRACGYTVDYPSDKPLKRHFRSLRESRPHAIVVDLTRLPSEGLHLAVAIRSRKTIRSIPIVFVDDVPEKVERIREARPDAIYTSRAELGSALKRAKPLPIPVSPSYSDRTAAQKLGIRESTGVAVLAAPRTYARAVGALPEGAWFEEHPEHVLPVTLWFVREPNEFLADLPRMSELAGRTRLWVIYPKQQARQKDPGLITLPFIRDEALGIGLVHRKTCSLDRTWTGMLFGLGEPR